MLPSRKMLRNRAIYSLRICNPFDFLFAIVSACMCTAGAMVVMHRATALLLLCTVASVTLLAVSYVRGGPSLLEEYSGESTAFTFMTSALLLDPDPASMFQDSDYYRHVLNASHCVWYRCWSQ